MQLELVRSPKPLMHPCDFKSRFYWLCGCTSEFEEVNYKKKEARTNNAGAPLCEGTQLRTSPKTSEKI